MNLLLESKALNKKYFPDKENELHALKDVNLKIEKGDFMSVMGPSGSGKSTLLYNISGMDKAGSGKVVFKDQDITNLSEKELSGLRLTSMGFIFQHIHLLKNLSIFDNVIMPGYLAKTLSRTVINKRASDLFETLGISAISDNDIDQASGGQLQRAGICRALINDPDIIFGDEPTGSLNSKAADEIIELLADINRRGTTIMLVTHDLRVAAKTERVIFMLDGRIVDEKRLGQYSPESCSIKDREEQLSHWLADLGF